MARGIVQQIGKLFIRAPELFISLLRIRRMGRGILF
jgi:hypothetical protein